MKKILYMTTLLLSCFLSTMAQGACTNNQTCGDNCCWELTQNGGTSENPTYKLTISGTGDMMGYFYAADIPWYSQANSITGIQISNGITSIGRAAFYNMSSVTNLTISDSVTSIGWGAFQNMRSVTSLTIPNSVTSIEDWAFQDMSGVTSLTIPDGVTSIGKGTFMNMNSLIDLTIPDTVELATGAFNGFNLTNATLHCAGVLAQCQANMAAAGYEDGTYAMVQDSYSKKNNDGTTTVYNADTASTSTYDAGGNLINTIINNANDGSVATYDANGNLIALKGKRIYTIDEVNQVTGKVNRVSIRYK